MSNGDELDPDVVERNKGYTVRKEQGFHKVIDHGGERRQTITGGEREVVPGKGRFDLIPLMAIRRLAKHYEAGSVKYAERNWEKGLEMHRFLESAFRHLADFEEGDRTEDHLAAILWNICGYMWTEKEILEGRLPKELYDVPWSPSVPE